MATEASLIIEGLLIGLSVAAPIGPMALLSIRRTIDLGFMAGLTASLGIAAADATYASIAAFGLTSLSDVLIDHQREIRLVGGIVLLIMGWRILKSARVQVQPASGDSLSEVTARVFVVMYALTLANPLTIASFAAIFAGLGLSLGSSMRESLTLVVSVFAGSALWWVMLGTLLTLLRTRLTPIWITRINLTAGALVIGFAIVALVSSFR